MHIIVHRILYIDKVYHYLRVGKGGYGRMDHVSQRKKKPFHDSRVLKKQFHGKLDSNKII
jgi:hypothetical protein